MQAIRDCLTSHRSKYEKKELVVKARISIATVTKMGKDSAVVSSDVFVGICTALGYMLDDIVGTVLD